MLNQTKTAALSAKLNHHLDALGRQRQLSDRIELLDDALRPFRALEWLIRGGTTAAHTQGDLAHLERGDLAELVATLTDAAQAKIETTLTLSKTIVRR